MPPKNSELIDFLIEKTKDVKSPLSVRELAREYKEKSGASQPIDRLRYRIGKIRSRVHEFDSINIETKVKMIFALSAPVENGFLKKLQKYAYVKVDAGNRIIMYKDGIRIGRKSWKTKYHG
ncbi:unnamed protein product [Caenorhabditis brenneri]